MDPLKELIQNIKQVWTSKMGEDASGVELVCKLHTRFGEIDPDGHNCFGCNLQHEVDRVAMFLESSTAVNNADQFATSYIMNLYLLGERILEIMRIIGLPRLYKRDVFEVFWLVKLWANFFKHPKAFVLVHHPLYFVEKVVPQTAYKLEDYLIIDDKFVKKYYSGEDANKYQYLFDNFRQNPKVCVRFPELIGLTERFCTATEVFIETIISNQVYLEILSDIGTLRDYFTSPDSDDVVFS